MSDKKEEKTIRHPADRRRRSKRTGHEVGDALRSAYDRTLKEDIPPEMLDLLGKLG